MAAAIAKFTDVARQDAGEMFQDDYRHILYRLCHKFHAQFGIDVDLLFSDACVLYLKAYQSPAFDATKACFNTWVNRIVWNGLIDLHCRTKAVRAKVKTVDMSDDLTPARTPNSWTVADFADMLTEDARAVLALVLDTPDDLYDDIQARGGAPRNVRGAVREYLTGLGWACNRISESYYEIMLALGE